MRCFASFFYIAFVILLSCALPAQATVFARVEGIVHDPDHRPIPGAAITLQADNSAFILHSITAQDGSFIIDQVPIGTYTLSAQFQGFALFIQSLTLTSGTHSILHIQLKIAQSQQTVVVHDPAFSASPDTVTPTTLVTREDIEATPGASRTIGMQMITDYVPGAYMTHDMLHMRGGHQISWLIDGIAIPNTKIASNVGPQIDPKDIDVIETQRGSYDADVGDRTYGVFNVLPRNGFGRDREGEGMLSGGNLGTGAMQISFGNHSEKRAWYASINGSRSNYGLATPVSRIDHDSTNSESGLVNVIYNQTPKDQLRFDGQYRQDYFDIPYDPNPNDWEQASQYYSSVGLRDAQTERDGYVIANWTHTLSTQALFDLAPFYHFNQANLDSLPTDFPAASTSHQISNYVGAQSDVRLNRDPNSFSAGLYTFYQSENDLYGVIVNDGSAASVPNQSARDTGGIAEFYFSDHLRLGKWISLLGGIRYSNFHGGLTESGIYPRIGATVEIPHLHWTLRGFYGHFFQPAPIVTVSQSALEYANSQPGGQKTFTPLPSERDEEHQFGIQIPYKQWVLDVTNVKNRVNNFLDHSCLGESNICFPIAIDGALIRAWELTLRSPQIAHRGQFHLAYSNQIAEQRGPIIGGFACNIPGDPACYPPNFNYTPLDHDQRNTLNTGFSAMLPGHILFSTNVYYGSGFHNGLAGAGQGPYNGQYLPSHTTFDLSASHALGKQWKISGTIINMTNHRVLQDNSVTVGGFHFNDPRMVQAELRYRFHY